MCTRSGWPASSATEPGRERFFTDVNPLDQDGQVSTYTRYAELIPIGSDPTQQDTLFEQVTPQSFEPIGPQSITKSLVRAGLSQETETYTHHRAGIDSTEFSDPRAHSPLPNTISQTLRFLHPALPLIPQHSALRKLHSSAGRPRQVETLAIARDPAFRRSCGAELRMENMWRWRNHGTRLNASSASSSGKRRAAHRGGNDKGQTFS